MDVDQMQALCAGLPGAWPDNPWDHEHPVFKVGPAERGKIFAFLGADTVGVKAGATPDDELVEAVEESYRLVVSRQPVRDRPDGWEAVSGGAASS